MGLVPATLLFHRHPPLLCSHRAFGAIAMTSHTYNMYVMTPTLHMSVG